MLSDHETKSTLYKQVHCAKECVYLRCVQACVRPCVRVCVRARECKHAYVCAFFDLHKDNMPSGSENK